MEFKFNLDNELATFNYINEDITLNEMYNCENNTIEFA